MNLKANEANGMIQKSKVQGQKFVSSEQVCMISEHL